MKNKRLWLSVTLTVLVVVCAMLIPVSYTHLTLPTILLV